MDSFRVFLVILLLVFPIAICASYFTSGSFGSPVPSFEVGNYNILVISGSFHTKIKLIFLWADF